MKTIIAGSRSVTDAMALIEAVAKSGFDITEVVSGGAQGADKLGEAWAFMSRVPVRRFTPNWNGHGRAAGMLRNLEMALYADALIAIWDGKSKGTEHMIAAAKKHHLKVFVHLVSP